MDWVDKRLEELGIDFAELNKRYCSIRRDRGDKKAKPINRRSILVRNIYGDCRGNRQGQGKNPSLSELNAIVQALDGKLMVMSSNGELMEPASPESVYLDGARTLLNSVGQRLIVKWRSGEIEVL